MKQVLIIAAIAGFLFSCNKTSSKQYTYWKVNGQEFSSNKVEVSETKGGSSLSETDGRFRLRFGLMNIPAYNMYILKHPMNNPEYAYVEFLHNNAIYTIAQDSVVLSFNQVDGKSQFVLPPTWFVSGTANDSVLIEATFNFKKP